MNKTLDILNPSGQLLRKHTLSANCIRKFSLMSEDSITLRFSEREAMRFPVGSSVGDFFITQEQLGKWNASTGVWDYELKFDAYYWVWKNKILRYIIPGIDSAKETSFTLTATIATHAQVIKNCLDLLGFKYDNSSFRIDTTHTSLSQEAKLVRYENLSILGGIQAIAEAFECEWWVKENAIYFGKCENSGSQHVFEAGINTSSISWNNAKSEAPNRLYVYGSDRNLPPNYRKTDGNDTIGGVVARRLMLPEGTPYLQTRPDIPESEIVEKVVTLDSVYPRTDLTVSDEPETYTSQGEDEEGNSTTETFYRLKYGDAFRFSESYVLPDEELHIVFQSGLLNGMDFGAKFNPKGLNEKNTDGSWNPLAQMIEIVVNEDYGRKLPDDVLKPQKGDKFILYGWDSTKMADLGLIADAEQELLEEGQKALEEYAKDLSSCTCPMAWDYMKPLFETNSQPKTGDVVTIIDTAHFGEGGRKSRIIGFEHKLDKPYAECIYTCGENVSVSRLASIEQKIDGLAKSGTKVQMQNSLDFLSKRYNDRTPYRVTSDTGFDVGDFVSGVSGARFAQNTEVEGIKVRSYAEFRELIVNRQTTIEGDALYTEGDMIEEVVAHEDGSYTLKLHPEWEGYTTAQIENNVIRGIFNDILNRLPTGMTGATSIKGATCYTSWMRVQSYNAAANTLDVVLYPDDQTPAGKNFPPQPMMKLARWGNSGDSGNPRYAMRQSCIVISSTEGRIMKLKGVTKPIIDVSNIAFVTGTLPEAICERLSLDPGTDGTYIHTLVAQNSYRFNHMGRPTPTIVFYGPYNPDEEDYRNGEDFDAARGDYPQHAVEYYGCQWLCNVAGTRNPPSWLTTDWTFYLGDPSFSVYLTGGPAAINPSRFSFTLTAHAEKYHQDVTAYVLPQDVVWTRYSEDRDGNPRTASDSIWATRRAGSGLSLTLTEADLDRDIMGIPPVCRFTVTVTLRDGTEATASIGYGNTQQNNQS